MVTSKPIRTNKCIVNTEVNTYTDKSATTKQIVITYAHDLDEQKDFTVTEVIDAYPKLNRRPVEKAVQELVRAEFLETYKCRCNQTNCFKKNIRT